eukprot:SAG11_NODE_159_length_14027_cov_6.893667_7_plen_228_part_00
MAKGSAFIAPSGFECPMKSTGMPALASAIAITLSLLLSSIAAFIHQSGVRRRPGALPHTGALAAPDARECREPARADRCGDRKPFRANYGGERAQIEVQLSVARKRRGEAVVRRNVVRAQLAQRREEASCAATELQGMHETHLALDTRLKHLSDRLQRWDQLMDVDARKNHGLKSRLHELGKTYQVTEEEKEETEEELVHAVKQIRHLEVEIERVGEKIEASTVQKM